MGVAVKGKGLGFEKTAFSEKANFNLKEMVGKISEQDLRLTLVDKGVQGRLLTQCSWIYPQ